VSLSVQPPEQKNPSPREVVALAAGGTMHSLQPDLASSVSSEVMRREPSEQIQLPAPQVASTPVDLLAGLKEVAKDSPMDSDDAENTDPESAQRMACRTKLAALALRLRDGEAATSGTQGVLLSQSTKEVSAGPTDPPSANDGSTGTVSAATLKAEEDPCKALNDAFSAAMPGHTIVRSPGGEQNEVPGTTTLPPEVAAAKKLLEEQKFVIGGICAIAFLSFSAFVGVKLAGGGEVRKAKPRPPAT